jgi:hypothetical protein
MGVALSSIVFNDHIYIGNHQMIRDNQKKKIEKFLWDRWTKRLEEFRSFCKVVIVTLFLGDQTIIRVPY